MGSSQWETRLEVVEGKWRILWEESKAASKVRVKTSANSFWAAEIPCIMHLFNCQSQNEFGSVCRLQQIFEGSLFFLSSGYDGMAAVALAAVGQPQNFTLMNYTWKLSAIQRTSSHFYPFPAIMLIYFQNVWPVYHPAETEPLLRSNITLVHHRRNLCGSRLLPSCQIMRRVITILMGSNKWWVMAPGTRANNTQWAQLVTEERCTLSNRAVASWKFN